jgi:polyisoprenoid-binding protein YceI
MTNPRDRALADTTKASLPRGAWRVALSRSEIGFTVKDMWGLRTVHGVFGAHDGTLEVRADGASGELTIEADSLDTGASPGTSWE